MPQVLTVEDTAGLPDELAATTPLWESIRGPTPGRAIEATRLYGDGRLYTWSNRRRVLVSGIPRLEAAPYRWRLQALVSGAGLAQVEDLLRGVAFAQLASVQGSPAPDAPVRVYRSWVDGVEKVVVLTGQAAAEPPRAIREVALAIQRNVVPGGVPAEN